MQSSVTYLETKQINLSYSKHMFSILISYGNSNAICSRQMNADLYEINFRAKLEVWEEIIFLNDQGCLPCLYLSKLPKDQILILIIKVTIFDIVKYFQILHRIVSPKYIGLQIF